MRKRPFLLTSNQTAELPLPGAFQKEASGFPKIGPRTLFLNARRLEGSAEMPGMILLAFEDVADREAALEALRDSHSV